MLLLPWDEQFILLIILNTAILAVIEIRGFTRRSSTRDLQGAFSKVHFFVSYPLRYDHRVIGTAPKNTTSISQGRLSMLSSIIEIQFFGEVVLFLLTAIAPVHIFPDTQFR